MTPKPPTRSPNEPRADDSVRIEVCEKHGLRYNAAVDDGCARCRTETGGRTVARHDFSSQRRPDLTRGLWVAAALVVGIGGSLFVAHTITYRAARTLIDQALEETSEDYEDDFETLFGDDSTDDN